MSQTLYRKYRPQKFSDIIGQIHIVTTLSNAIKRNLVGHAYLFTGPRGTGKTTIARIFAAEVNCAKRKDFTPASQDVCKRLRAGTALDVIEIDAASHTSVENIRELKETIVLPPVEAPYKIYIIDEVHMLSTSAFNALLKTLEEPPAHAIFILATTEIHKVPETILSRVQRFDFTRLTLPHIVSKLSFIAKSEKITIDADALEMIAISAEGGMRDAESTLAQVIALEDKKITATEVASILGSAEREKIFTFLTALCHRETEDCLRAISELATHGYDLRVFAKSLITQLRTILFLAINEELNDTLNLSLTKEQQKELLSLATDTSKSFLVQAIEEFTTAANAVGTSMIPELPLEIAVVKLCEDDDRAQKAHAKSPLSAPEEKSSPSPQSKRAIRKIAKTSSVSDDSVSSDAVVKKWEDCVAEVKKENNSLAGLLKNAHIATVTDELVTIAVRYGFHRDKIMQGDNKLTIQNALATICGVHCGIDAIVDASIAQAQDKDKKSTTSTLLTGAAALMGGTVVQES